jgi:hypothetical protein
MTAWIATAPGYRAAAGASTAAPAAVVGGVEDGCAEVGGVEDGCAVVGGVEDGCAEVGGAEDGATDNVSDDDTQPSRSDGLDGTGEGGTECLATAIRGVGA